MRQHTPEPITPHSFCERQVAELRDYETPPPVKVYDREHHLIKTEQPVSWASIADRKRINTNERD